MAKETLAFFASQLQAARAKLHAACRSKKADAITKALEDADRAFDKYVEMVNQKQDQLEKAKTLI